MKRTAAITTNEMRQKRIATFQRLMGEVVSRASLASKLGQQYEGYRKLYKSLGYPTSENELTFTYFYNLYDRNPFATAVVDRPCDKTWTGTIKIIEPNTQAQESKLLEQWNTLNDALKIKQRLNNVDKLAGIGKYSVLLFGFSDVKKQADFATPVKAAGELKLLYLKAYSEDAVSIVEWEDDTTNERYGSPRMYEVTVNTAKGGQEKVKIHHSRMLHVVDGSLLSDVEGRPRLRPILNRLEDLDKILGGDAEMFWRGARPGYHAKAQEGFELSSSELDDLEDELDKWEHDLRRFLTSQGVDIEALQQQFTDPLGHIDAQLQAISAQTGIPKRILVGSERGELASSQDSEAWLSLIKTRMEEYAEPNILRPVVDRLMKYKVLTPVKDYNVQWEDLFAPSDKDKAEVGKTRSEAWSKYTSSPMATEMLPVEQALKLFLLLSEEQLEEVIKAIEEHRSELEAEEDELLAEAESIAREAQARGGNGNEQDVDDQGNPIGQPPVPRQRTRQNGVS